MTSGEYITIATLLGGFAAQAWRENRNRKWATEDRERAAKEAETQRKAATIEIIERAKAEAEALKIKTEAIAVTLRQESRISEDALSHQVREATEAAHSAYKEANNVNLKIEHLNERLLAKEAEPIVVNKAVAAQIDTIEDTTDRIEQQTKTINKKIE